MKLAFRALRSAGAALLVGALALGASSCGDDDPTPAPPPRYAPITVFNAVTDIIGTTTQFKIGETVIATNVAYGTPTPVTQALVGTGTQVTALSSAGTSLGSANVGIDTNRSVWVIVAGEALTQKSAVFGVSHAEPQVPSGSALIRAIHASHNAPKIDVRQENSLGSTIATGISYKGSGDFTAVNPGIAKISITKSEGDKAELLSFSINPPLQAGRIYNLIIYGSADPTASDAAKIQAKIVPEP